MAARRGGVTMSDWAGMRITEEAEREYIRTGGQSCPRCGSHDLEGSALDIEGSSTSQEIICAACYLVWIDVYELHHIVVQDYAEGGSNED
jgi:hypothetical protein